MSKFIKKESALVSTAGSCTLTLDRHTAQNLLLALTNALDASGGKSKKGVKDPGSKKGGVKDPGPKAFGVKSPGPKAFGVKSPGPKAAGVKSPGPKAPGAKR
jgi:hypothetical protein